jgi:arylsulfatase A-like enzyme
MYEGGLKVPFAAVWPGQIPAGARGDRIALTMDLFPTLCEAAGVPVSHAIEGRSILPVLRAQPYAEEQRDLFFHRREGGERYGGLTIQAVRRGDWKLLRNSPFAPAELYNLRDDPREERDLASSDRKTYRELLKALSVQTQRGGAIPWQPPARAVAP